MKKVVLASLIIISGLSQAMPVKTIGTKLQLATTPLMDRPGVDKRTTVVTLKEDGKVIGSKCQESLDIKLGVGRPVYTNCEFVHIIDRLTETELNQLDSLIAEAKEGEVEFPRPGAIHCMAMPVVSQRYTAENGSVVLSIGTHPCGNVTYNKAQAARELVKVLVEMSAKYNALDN